MAEIDFEACMRYVRGESSLEEAKAVRTWLKDPANELVARHWMSTHAASLEALPQTTKLTSFNYAGMRSNLHSRMGVDVNAEKEASTTFGWRRWAAAAAIAGVAASVSGTLYLQHTQLAKDVATTTRVVNGDSPVRYSTAYGQTREVQLPDGSTVTLNANSTLRYAAVWNATAPREVWLDGEAYFSIKHLPNHQRFRVHTTGNFNVEVLGTKFTVYRRHEQERVVLLSGKVRVDFNDKRQADVILKPGELLQTTDAQPKHITHKVVEAPTYAAFTNRKLVLDDTPISELATQLHDIYGLDVVVLDPALNQQTITGTVPVGDVDLLCQALQASFNIKVERQSQRILLSLL